MAGPGSATSSAVAAGGEGSPRRGGTRRAPVPSQPDVGVPGPSSRGRSGPTPVSGHHTRAPCVPLSSSAAGLADVGAQGAATPHKSPRHIPGDLPTPWSHGTSVCADSAGRPVVLGRREGHGSLTNGDSAQAWRPQPYLAGGRAPFSGPWEAPRVPPELPGGGRWRWQVAGGWGQVSAGRGSGAQRRPLPPT